MHAHSQLKTWGALGAIAVLPSAAMAHTGVGSTSGLVAGLSHPLGGLDHLMAMLAVGLWAGQAGGRSLWAIPVAFVLAMVFGGVAANAGIAIPFVEQGILMSVIVSGFLVAAAVRMPLLVSTMVAGGFALFHGYAHGAEMPLAAGFVSYSVGFVLASSLLVATGVVAANVLKRMSWNRIGQGAGALIALAGSYLAIA